MQSSNKKVTVIITTYKRSRFLKRAIDSVLSQTYKNVEIIVVDDNDENSIFRKQNEALLASYHDAVNLIYLKHKKNMNGAAARNTGIKKSSGAYITFLDDDDFFLKDRVEKMVQALEANPGYDCAYSGLAFTKGTKIKNIKRAKLNGDLAYEVLSQDSFFGTGSNIFLTRKAVDAVGLFDENFIRHQDMEYMVRFFEFGKILNVDEILVVKCMDDGQNRPDFAKMKKVKQQFLGKFKAKIDSFSEAKRSHIYFCNYLELMDFAAFNSAEYKKVEEMIQEIKSLNADDLRKLRKYDSRRKNVFLKIVYKIKNALIARIDVVLTDRRKKVEIKEYL